MKQEKWWEFSIGVYPGILLGFRSYEFEDSWIHVFYIPFVDFGIELSK